ncbi:MAG: beta-ketoacyl synthase chain length factor [Bacteroidales bacterium]|nr:beta-ketoacyl synthase chain length factor [Bacteroidales bacterium]
MAVYIKSLSCISPLGTDISDALPTPQNGYFKAVEPDYRKYIDPMVSRRMSRIVKKGIYGAKSCLEKAGTDMPEAIVTGTGLGCIEDTEKFLITMIKNEEKFLNPTPFIQSTHNTVSSQISLFLKCHAYNVTYSHRGLSFESALLDSIMLLQEKSANSVLLAGIDELTENSFHIQKRLGLWKSDVAMNYDILKSTTKGSIAGEGATFFFLSSEKNENNNIEIVALKTWNCKENSMGVKNQVVEFLKENNCQPEDIDLLMLGYSGDNKTDSLYTDLSSGHFPHSALAFFKHLCGEYQTASSFGLALAAEILRKQNVPDNVKVNKQSPKRLNNILLYNHFQNINHSLVLIRYELI